MTTPIEDLKKYEAALGTYIAELQALELREQTDPHFHPLPDLVVGAATAPIMRLLQFQQPRPAPPSSVNGPAAGFFYEAYRKALPGIFAAAIEAAKTSIAPRAASLRAQLVAQEAQVREDAMAKLSALNASLASLDAFVAPSAPPPAPPSAPAKKRSGK